jgi:hypothetical protein
VARKADRLGEDNKKPGPKSTKQIVSACPAKCNDGWVPGRRRPGGPVVQVACSACGGKGYITT